MAVYELGGAKPEFHPETWVAPSADIIGSVRLHKLASVWFSAVLRGDNELISVGQGSNIQDGCMLHTDKGIELNIGAYCTIGHKAILHGCNIGDESLIGMGAIVLNHAKIGRNCLIGAGALIPEGKIIPDNSLVVGMPGKIIRVLEPAQASDLRKSAEGYVRNWQRFAKDLKPISK
jgi:carbonic anhydrase/acetyltransferase-like protein (isoleucine patch superfamily)